MELAEFARLPLGDVLVGVLLITQGGGQAMSSSRHHDEGYIRPKRSRLLAPIVVLILTLSAIAGVWMLVGRASSSRVAELHVSSMGLPGRPSGRAV
jgi:hypothetical protein